MRAALISLGTALIVFGALVGWREFQGDKPSDAAAAPPAYTSHGINWAASARAEALAAFGPDMRAFNARGRFAARAGGTYAIGQAPIGEPAGECLSVVGPGGDTGSACSEPRLFSRGPVIWLEGFEGGPTPTTRSSEYVAGIAIEAVKRVDVIRSDGASSPASLSEDNAFFFELDPADLARGVYLDHLEARGASGRLVKRIEMNDGS